MTALTLVTPAVSVSLDPLSHSQAYMSDLPLDISTWMAIRHFIVARFIDNINILFANLLISCSSCPLNMLMTKRGEKQLQFSKSNLNLSSQSSNLVSSTPYRSLLLLSFCPQCHYYSPQQNHPSPGLLKVSYFGLSTQLLTSANYFTLKQGIILKCKAHYWIHLNVFASCFP